MINPRKENSAGKGVRNDPGKKNENSGGGETLEQRLAKGLYSKSSLIIYRLCHHRLMDINKIGTSSAL